MVQLVSTHTKSEPFRQPMRSEQYRRTKRAVITANEQTFFVKDQMRAVLIANQRPTDLLYKLKWPVESRPLRSRVKEKVRRKFFATKLTRNQVSAVGTSSRHLVIIGEEPVLCECRRYRTTTEWFELTAILASSSRAAAEIRDFVPVYCTVMLLQESWEASLFEYSNHNKCS